MYINNLGHMTKMAAMPIYGKNPSDIFSETDRLTSMKLGVKHPWQYYNVYMCDDLDQVYGKVNMGCPCI